jgi:integrase
MAKHKLDTLTITNAKPDDKAYRLLDGSGLFLLVSTTGVKSWQFRYKLDGKHQTATLGRFPRVTLKQARDAAEKARDLADEGRHVTVEKKLNKAINTAAAKNTFGELAKSWLKVRARRDRWTPGYVREATNSIENHLSDLNGLPVSKITAALCAPMLAKVERSAPDMERKVRQRLRAIFDYAVELGLTTGNPIPSVRRRRLERRHFPAVLQPAGVGAILRAAEASDVCRGVKRGHLMLAFTAQRVGEIVGADWTEFDLKAGTWTIPRARMKRKEVERGDHVIPLPPGLLAQVKEWHRIDGDGRNFVCPAPRGDDPVTREAVEKFYRRGLNLSGQHSPHSWRSVFSTWARDAGKDADAVEAQLDHATGSTTETSYDRSKRIERRRALLAWHESALIAARDGAAVLPFTKPASKG